MCCQGLEKTWLRDKNSGLENGLENGGVGCLSLSEERLLGGIVFPFSLSFSIIRGWHARTHMHKNKTQIAFSAETVAFFPDFFAEMGMLLCVCHNIYIHILPFIAIKK